MGISSTNIRKDLFSLDPAQFDVEMLQKYDGGASKDVYKIVTGDESLIAYEPETKQQFTKWVLEPGPNPRKAICGKIILKQMVACFFCKTGHVATVPLEHRR